jgi:recombination protein RecT
MSNVAKKEQTVSSILSQDTIQKRFKEILGKEANAFISSIVSATKSNPHLMKCEPSTVISSAVIAATLKLPIQSNLGFSYIVPYKGNAQFQMGYKGFIQLAIRTGQYETMNATAIYDGELIKNDRITGEIEVDVNKKRSNDVIGYLAYFKLVSGFKKTLYMSYEEIEKHGKKYSQSYSKPHSVWKKDFDSMALKTVLKLLLSKYGIMSVEMQTAITVDQSVIKDADTLDIDYVDAKQESNALDFTEAQDLDVKKSSLFEELEEGDK